MMNVIGNSEFAPGQAVATRGKVISKFDPCVSCPMRGDECFETFQANACEKAVEAASRLGSGVSYAKN